MRRGFSLVEVTVAMLLLSIGLLGVAGTGLLAGRLLRESEGREAMVERASNILDSLSAHAASGGGTVMDARYRIDWAASDSAVHVRALLPDGSRYDMRALR